MGTTTTTTLQQIQTHYEVYWMDCFFLLLWLQQLLQGPLHFQNLNIVAMPTLQSVSHARLVYRWRSSARQTLPFRSVLSNSLQFVAMPTMQSVSHARKVYRKRSSAGYTLPFPDVLLRLQFVATPTMQNVRHASSV